MTNKLKSFSAIANNNSAAPPFGFPENQTPSSVNNAARQLMASVREWYEDAEWIDVGDVVLSVSGQIITLTGNQVARYSVNRAIRVNGVIGYISASALNMGNTDVTVVGFSPAAPVTSLEVGIAASSNVGPSSAGQLRADVSANLGTTPTIFATYATRAAANSALAGVPANAYAIITNDESFASSPKTRVQKVGGVYVLDANLDQLRTDLALPTGTNRIGAQVSALGSASRSLTSIVEEKEWALEDFFPNAGTGADDTAAFTLFQTAALAEQATNPKVLNKLNLRQGVTYRFKNPYWSNNIKQLIVEGNGATLLNTATATQDNAGIIPATVTMRGGLGTFYTPVDRYLLNTTTVGSTSVTAITAADAGNFSNGEWVMVASFDQQFAGQPPSYKFWEYCRVAGTPNVTTGVIPLDRRLRHVHRSDFPYLATFTNGDGRANIYKIEQGSSFDIEQEFKDIVFAYTAAGGARASYAAGRHIKFTRCTDLYILATQCMHAEIADCQITTGFEIDKLVDLVEFKGGEFKGRVSGGTAVRRARFERVKMLGGYFVSPQRLELVDVETHGLGGNATPGAGIDQSVGFCTSVMINGGTHERLPNYSQNPTQCIEATIGVAGVTWTPATNTLNIPIAGAAGVLKNFIAASGVQNQLVHVVQVSAGTYRPTGVIGTVESVTGDGTGVSANIVIQFNAPLAGTEILCILSEPFDVDISGAQVNGSTRPTKRDFLAVRRKRYEFYPALIPSAFLLNNQRLEGLVTRLRINVLRAYTGATAGNITLSVSSIFPSSARFSRTVDLRTVGLREATLFGSVGFSGVSGESAAANLGVSWTANFASSFLVSASTMASTSNDQLPIVSVEFEVYNPYFLQNNLNTIGA